MERTSTSRVEKEGDVSCRNLALMYNYFLNVKGWNRVKVDDLFLHSLPESLPLEKALDPDHWIDHRTYDQTVRNIVLVNQHDRRLLFEMGSKNSKCESTKDMIRKLRMLVFSMGLSVRGVYEKLIPTVVPAFNKTKEFRPMELSDEGCTYMIRMFQLVDPLNDWTSDWWIRGILSEPTTIFKLAPAKVTAKVLPFDIVLLLTKEFSELGLQVELSGQDLLVNGQVCGRKVYLKEDKVSSLGKRYFSGNWTEVRPTAGVFFEGVRIVKVLPEMGDPSGAWQAVQVGEIYIPYREFDRQRVEPYFILDIRWGKIPWFYKLFFRILSIFSLFGRNDVTELKEKISQMSERLADADSALADRTVALRSARDELEEKNAFLLEQKAKIEGQEKRIRDLFLMLHPSNRMAEIVIDKGRLEPQMMYMSVLYVDLVGSTAATRTLGAEAYNRQLSKFYDIVEKIIFFYKGGCYKRVGDEEIGFWCLGLTTEAFINIGDQAILAALSIRHALQNEPGFDFPVRIGVATGVALVGSVGSTRATIEINGPVMNDGARHLSAGRPWDIVFDEATFNEMTGEKRALFCQEDKMSVQHNVQLKGLDPKTLFTLKPEEIVS